MQFVQGRLQGRYRANRAVNETVSAPFPAAAAWGRPVKAVPPLHLVLAVRQRTVRYTVRIGETGSFYGTHCEELIHVKVRSTRKDLGKGT